METPQHFHWSTFVIRLWRETEGGEWRGQIIHLQTRQERHFVTLAQAQAFVSQHAPGVEAQTVSFALDAEPSADGAGPLTDGEGTECP